MTASAAPTTAGCSTPTAAASTSRASPTAAATATRYRQPWYPVVEYHGLVFAYLGPADSQPVFPRYDIFEDLGDDEEIVIIDHFAFGGPSEAPCNWFQTHENAMDPYHVFILHNAISGHQFDPRLDIWPSHRLAAPRLGRHRHPGPPSARRHACCTGSPRCACRRSA